MPKALPGPSRDTDTHGRPIANCCLDVWSGDGEGIYDMQMGADAGMRLRARFYHAGIRSRSAPLLFFALKALLALGLPLVLWLGVQFSTARIAGQTVLMLLVLVAAVGYYLPNLVLGSMAAVAGACRVAPCRGRRPGPPR